MNEHESLLQKFTKMKSDHVELQSANDVFQEAVIKELAHVNKLISDKNKNKKKNKIHKMV